MKSHGGTNLAPIGREDIAKPDKSGNAHQRTESFSRVDRIEINVNTEGN